MTPPREASLKGEKTSMLQPLLILQGPQGTWNHSVPRVGPQAVWGSHGSCIEGLSLLFHCLHLGLPEAESEQMVPSLRKGLLCSLVYRHIS